MILNLQEGGNLFKYKYYKNNKAICLLPVYSSVFLSEKPLKKGPHYIIITFEIKNYNSSSG